MGCLYFLAAALAPRVFLAVIFLFTGWFHLAFETTLWPVVGFLAFPYTTLAYMGAMLHGGVGGVWLALLVLAVVADLAQMGGAKAYAPKRKRARK